MGSTDCNLLAVQFPEVLIPLSSKFRFIQYLSCSISLIGMSTPSPDKLFNTRKIVHQHSSHFPYLCFPSNVCMHSSLLV